MNQEAKWIWLREPAQPDEYAEFLLPFEAKEGGEYTLKISADSDYALYLGEKLISFGQYADYLHYKVYDTVLLPAVAGVNELRILAWHYGIDTQTHIKKEAGIRFELLENGAVIALSSPAVQSRPAPCYIPHGNVVITKQLGQTFYYDATQGECDFAPSRLASDLPEQVYPRPNQKLVLKERVPMSFVQQGGFAWRKSEYYSSDALPVKMATATLYPRNGLIAQEAEHGVYCIVDLQKETAGFLDLDIEVPQEAMIEIAWGEHLADGRVRTSVRNFTCRYKAKAGRNTYLNPFRRLGCRYLQLFIYAPEAKVHYAGIRPTLYPLKEKPFSGSPLQEKIYGVAVETLRHCMHEHYEDCPWREQALYNMDSRNEMLFTYYAFDDTEFIKSNLELMTHGLRADGFLPLCFPAGLDLPIPSFNLAYFLQMEDYLHYTGDMAFIKEKYPFMQKLMQAFLDRPKKKGLYPNFPQPEFWNFYEWKPGLDGSEPEGTASVDAPFNAFFVLALQSMARMAVALGEKDPYSAIATQLNQEIAAQFFDEGKKLFRSFDHRRLEEYSVLTNSLCLLSGAADGLDHTAICKLLVANDGVKAIPCTVSMSLYRFEALLKEDRERYAPLILAEIDGVYGAMLEQGATTFWETALGEKDFRGAGSLCHGWSALPIYYYQTLL